MATYTPQEYANMHYIYGECRGNGRAAARLYRERYPRATRYPDHRVFINVHRSLCDGRFPNQVAGEGRPVNDFIRDEVLEAVSANPSISVRGIEADTGIPKSTAHSILQKEEYDTNPSSEDESDASAASDDSKKEKKKKDKPKKAITISEAPRKRKDKTKKREKDTNAPKRPTSAFMLWLNESRKQILEDNPGIKVTEVAKKGGEMWRELKDKPERKAVEKKASKPSPAKKSKNTSGTGSGGKFTSKEYIEDEDSSSDSGSEKKKKDKKDSKDTKKDSKKDTKKASKKSSDEESAVDSGSAEESGSD